MSTHVGLVVGVTGIVGLNLAERLLEEKWKVYGISRKRPDFLPPGVDHVAIDVTDPAICKAGLSGLKDVEYVFYATWQNKGSEKENCKVNKLMVENLIDNLPTRPKHVALVTGTKNYLGPFEKYASADLEVPFKESLPRVPYDNFYYDQEDVVFDRAAKMGFTWSVARPSTIIGFAPFNLMNFGTSLAVYASVCKHLSLPFVFPGGKAAYDPFMDVTDARFLAEHLLWEATTPAAANQAFNVVNGDVFRWLYMWKSIAAYFNIKVEEPPEKAIDMNELMEDKGEVWDEIVSKNGLKKMKMKDLVSWWHMNLDASRTRDVLSDMNKSREKGFLAYKQTEKSFFGLFDHLKKEKYIP